MTRLAIVGSGIAGLGLAYYLRNQFEITIFEKNDRLGGHTNTISVSEGDQQIPIDTGFMVFNHVTYPNLVKLFSELEVPMKKTDMSFSVQHLAQKLEFSGASFERLFGDRRNLLNLKYWKMLLQIDRFNKEATQALEDPEVAGMSMREYVKSRNYGNDFLNNYLVPMSSALWSTPPQKIIEFPVISLLRFFHNHGLLGVDTQHQWWTVDGGSVEYLKRLRNKLTAITRVAKGVQQVKRGMRYVSVTTNDGATTPFDLVAFACHADEALSILADPSDKERLLLSAFSYQQNDTLLHTDESVMPKERRCWSSWNVRLENERSSTHYWMNSLQGVSQTTDYFVSLNAGHIIDPAKVKTYISYQHPVFDLGALRAQRVLPELNLQSPRKQVFFCGSYFGYGFHEDALTSSLNLASVLQEAAICR